MRGFLIIAALGISTFLGFYPGLTKAKPLWWKLLAVALIAVACIFSLLPPITANSNELMIGSEYEGYEIQTAIFNVDVPNEMQEALFTELNISDSKSFLSKENTKVIKQKKLVIPLSELKYFKQSGNYVLKAKYNKNTEKFECIKFLEFEPMFKYPLLLSLMERIRILNFHVPQSWIASVSFLISMIFSVLYLRKPDIKNDIGASSAAAVGVFFVIMAIVTGMVWAKFNWGAFWNWDPRQTTIFILLLMYSGYFILRGSIDKTELKMRLSAVYSIICFVTVPFLIFIIPRMMPSLHPGGKDDGNTGPVMDTQQGMLDSDLALSYYVSLMAFFVIFYWILSLVIRYRTSEEKIKQYELSL